MSAIAVELKTSSAKHFSVSLVRTVVAVLLPSLHLPSKCLTAPSAKNLFILPNVKLHLVRIGILHAYVVRNATKPSHQAHMLKGKANPTVTTHVILLSLDLAVLEGEEPKVMFTRSKLAITEMINK